VDLGLRKLFYQGMQPLLLGHAAILQERRVGRARLGGGSR
jgi:hypothetical protein